MVLEFLRKRQPPPPPRPPEWEKALADLERLARDRPALGGHARLLGELLPELFPDSPADAPPVLTAEQAKAKRLGGIPLLRGETPALDRDALRRRWLRMCTTLGRLDQAAPANRLADALGRGLLDPAELAGEVIGGRPETIHAHAEALDLDSSLTATVLRFTLFPAFSRIHATLAPLVEGIAWGQGFCPTCGSWPLLGEYRGLEQTRWLRCGLCTAEWEYPRLGCPFCETRDHNLLGYFGMEGEETRYRAATCDGCRGYVKMVSTLGRLSGIRLLVEDVSTLYLDLAAAQRGFGV